jgi:hypothetical protein
LVGWGKVLSNNNNNQAEEAAYAEAEGAHTARCLQMAMLNESAEAYTKSPKKEKNY